LGTEEEFMRNIIFEGHQNNAKRNLFYLLILLFLLFGNLFAQQTNYLRLNLNDIILMEAI